MECPSRSEFAAGLVGKLDEGRLNSLFAHLDQCGQCRQLVEGLDPIADDVLDSLPQRAVDLAITPDCERMMAAAERLSGSFPKPKLSMTPAKSPDVPRHIRDYELIEPIGEGGMGTLYRAVHTRLKREVVVKMMAPRQMHQLSAVNRFRREMEAVGKLEHPNIVRAFDAGEQDGIPYLVMELLEGLDLRQVLKRIGPLSIEDACEVVRQAAEGLHYAHRKGLVHRDVKPSNLMLAADATVKLLDLGLALLSDVSGDLTLSQLAIGSVDYMAPEQADDSHTVDAKADLYSLGCTLYHMLCGVAPHGGDANLSLIQRLHAHANEAVAPLSYWRADAPPDLVDLVAAMLEKAPGDRPPSAAAVSARLAPLARGADLVALLDDAIRGRAGSRKVTFVPLSDGKPQSSAARTAASRKSTQRDKSPLKSARPRRAAVAPDIEISTQRQRDLLRDLAQLVAERSEAEVHIHQSRSARESAAENQYREEEQRITAARGEEISGLRSRYRQEREAVISKYESDGYELLQHEEQFAEKAVRKHALALEEAKHVWIVSKERVQEYFDANKDAPKHEFALFKQQCDQSRIELQGIEKQAAAILRRRKCPSPGEPSAPVAISGNQSKETYIKQFAATLPRARQALQAVHNRRVARFLEEGWPWLLLIFTSFAAMYPAWLLWNWGGIAAAVAAGAVVFVALQLAIRPVARRRTLEVLPPLRHTIDEAHAQLDAAVGAAKLEAEKHFQELVARRDRQAKEAADAWEATRDELNSSHERHMRKTADDYRARRKAMTDDHDQQLAQLDATYPPRIEQLEQDLKTDLQRISDDRLRELMAAQQEFEQSWHDLVARWRTGTSGFQAEIDAAKEFCDDQFRPWNDMDEQSWQPCFDDLTALRFGEYRFGLTALEHGQSEVEELKTARTEFVLPAVLSFPACPSLLLKADGAGRGVAIRTVQNVMLRLLAALPPGKVRFTIIDPVGLGQNFSAFMHLADFDDRLVSNRIWTESNHINKQLTDLTQHMEDVIQKYLRNEFDSIQQYNRHAGEVAEPFRILVVANFPANFSDESARRLVSIASSGARCGVYTLISVDTKMKLPRNFDLADLESHAETLQWTDGEFRFQHEDLARLPLTLDSPPDDDRFTGLVRVIGQHAKDSSRVEVPFETVVAPPGGWWANDSRAELEVALGRAGATKLQSMRLGKGTSQHVLISGKTGSGKSTLLHALITNLALHYSPDEVQFYLIDFKKGVEFKAYATFSLPHARVIAIESEREFGMSVLQRLDLELRQRGDLFRQRGVQDVKGFRDANPDAVMPRILLIIDEFQEFFVSDDAISQDAALLLDRLVRQGRAFGIHVLLGSQTLAGAYTLARSTIGQMAVRIALQCSEGDAHLILSEENTAARLLNRPGEAIYNDANGLLEGNHPFQVVWLSDHERENYLRQIAELARQRDVGTKPPIVFEGNVAADASQNELLRQVLESPADTKAALAPRAWLGAAVSIKEPTDVVFHRQSGKNLLIVGQQEEMAQGVLINCLFSLAAQASTPRGDGLHPFYVLDGSRPDSPEAGLWRRIAKQLPIDIACATPRDFAPTMGAISDEVNRRLETGDAESPAIFIFINNLARFRELRKSEDYSFSSFDENAAPAVDKQFATILREGPAHGVHVLIWSDTYNNTNRWLDRQTMHDLEMRVLFQMGATDSSNLMDGPAASRLGIHRAILYSEEQGQFEKFRPYGLPDESWLQWVAQQLASRLA